MRETARQRFIRNSGERGRMMLMRAIESEREGDWETASRIRAIAETWQMIREKAEEQEEK